MPRVKGGIIYIMHIPLREREIEKLYSQADTNKNYQLGEKGLLTRFKEIQRKRINNKGITYREYLDFVSKFLGINDNLGLYKNKKDQESNHKYLLGKVIGFSGKGAIANRQGQAFSTLSNFLKHSINFTHVFPNECLFVKKVNNSLVGFKESNLSQIQVFPIDLDFPTDLDGRLECDKALDYYSNSDNNPFTVGAVIKTHKGIQLLMVLDKPSLVDKKGNTIKVLKKSAMSLRNWYKENTPYGKYVDMNCNLFGIMRMPQLANLVSYHTEGLPSFDDLMQFSIKYTKENIEVRESTGINKPKELTNVELPIESRFASNHTDSVFHGVRNDTLFCLALLCYGHNVAYPVTCQFINSFNARLKEPLSSDEIKALLASAYSGRYQGATKYYKRRLLNSILTEEENKKVWIHYNWKKFKKDEEDKVRHAPFYTTKVVIDYLKNKTFNKSKRAIKPVEATSLELTGNCKVSKSKISKFNNLEAKNNHIQVIKRKRKPTLYFFIGLAYELIKEIKDNYHSFLQDTLFVKDVVACLTMVSTDTKEINPVGKEPPKYWQLSFPLVKKIV